MVPCAVWRRRAVPPFGLEFCGAVLLCSVLCVVLWCLALLCCGLLRAVRCSLWRLVCCAVLLDAAACCAAVPGCLVRLRCSQCCLLSGFCLPCRVLWCAVSLGAVLRRVAARCSARRCAVVCCVAFFCLCGAYCDVPSDAVRCPGVLYFPELCFEVFPRAVCSVLCMFCRGVMVCAVVHRCALCCVCPGVSCCVFPVLSDLCVCVVLFVWSALLLAPCTVVRCCVLCCFLWCSVVRCWVWLPALVFWWRVSVSVSLSGRVASFTVVGVGCALWCCTVVWCCAVVLCCPFAVLYVLAFSFVL